jgi:hypothetical protein
MALACNILSNGWAPNRHATESSLDAGSRAELTKKEAD